MALRSAHGKARESGRIVVVEGLAADELPEGVPAPSGTPEPLERTAAGRFANREAAAAAGRRGGLARAGKLKALQRLGLPEGAGGPLAPFLGAAEAWAVAEVQRLARDVGGGVASPNVCAMVQSAALALAGSRMAYSTGDVVMGAKLSAECRAGCLAAHELAAREAKARGPRVDPALARLFDGEG